MNHKRNKVAIVAGVGPGLGMSLCKDLITADYSVAGLSRSSSTNQINIENYLPVACDLTNPASVDSAFTLIEKQQGKASVYIHNAAYLLNRDFLQTSPEDFKNLWEVSCLGAVQGIQRVLPNMLINKSGTILVTGATASVKAGAKFSAFSSAKFALRGLCQSLAREYGPQGIHFAHIIIDGAVWGEQARNKFGLDKEICLLPDDIAETYLQIIKQPRSAWTQELDLRPDCENF